MKKLLIVDDEEQIVQALQPLVGALGIQVLTAVNGEEGLEKALSAHPDLILLDIIMPKMHGLDMLEKLREDVWGKDANVIILTNFKDTTKVRTAEEHGALEYILKTEIRLEDIVAKVKKHLELQ